MTELTGERWLQSHEKAEMDKERARQLLEVSLPFLRSLGKLSLTSYGLEVPPFYVEMRRGEGGEEIAFAKSRTIPENMAAKDIPVIFQAIRMSGMDELIQAVHVLDGTMLLSGRPRPLVQRGSESTHESVEMMEKYLPSSVFKDWLYVYDLAPPGLLSSYGNVSKTLADDLELHCRMRAKLDIEDAELASPERDIAIVKGAVTYLDRMRFFNNN